MGVGGRTKIAQKRIKTVSEGILGRIEGRHLTQRQRLYTAIGAKSLKLAGRKQVKSLASGVNVRIDHAVLVVRAHAFIPLVEQHLVVVCAVKNHNLALIGERN